MKERVELLGILVDVASTKEASETTISYIEEEGSKVVYFINSETLLLLEENSDWKEAVLSSELILPGASNIDSSVNDTLGHKRDPFFFESYLDAILDYIVEMGLDILLVADSEQQFQSVQANIHEKRPFLHLSGIYKTNQDESYEHIVNEINAVAPDVLFIACEQRMQLDLLEKYHNLMNAGIVLFLGDLLYHKAVIDEEIPQNIEKMNLNNFYRFIKKGGRIKAFVNHLRMHFRLRFHNNESEGDK
ncbi:MAG: WecB/TagA/CpsF family glycosyltransferase [Lachnospiraceae bacterium]